MADNPYLDAITRTLPRLLALFDRDRTSASHGMGDRFHWAWGLIDFGNATFQGAAHGMARLWRAGLWPHATPPDLFIGRIDALFEAARRLTRRDGSLEEAFPNEGSFCVTALVVFDLLRAIDLLGAELPLPTADRWKAIVAPMIGYLHVADETHAFISNHLATAAAALARWHALVGDARSEARARAIVERILAEQSNEGWFKEYDGADPGYQSLCTYYLADVHECRPDWQLAEPLARSIRFLWHFAHPDGSFGGIYGSRCTRLFYPAGIEALAAAMPEAAALAQHMARSIASQRVVTLDSMDEPNLVPMFNAYCWAATLSSVRPATPAEAVLPAARNQPMRIHFPHAGLWIDAGPRHYSIVSTNKGGVVLHFRDGCLATLDGGVVVRGRGGRLGSSQAFVADNKSDLDGDQLSIETPIRPMSKRLPTPAEFVVLRLLCISVFRVRALREWVKRRLVGLLIAPQAAWPVSNRRRIRFGPDLSVDDELRLAPGYTRIDAPGEFVAIHMASQGYWQVQDEARPR